MPRFNEHKALSTMLYFLSKAGGSLDLYKLLKLVYIADKRHLREWGRTISSNCYARLKRGPVPSEAYNMLKSVRGGEEEWNQDLSGFFSIDGHRVTGLLAPDMEEFSKSDIQVLDCTFEDFGNVFIPDEEIHDEAYNRSSSHWMTLEDLALGDETLVEHIRRTGDEKEFLDRW